jgi:hypothetical protein
MFKRYLRTRFHSHGFNGSLVIGRKAKYPTLRERYGDISHSTPPPHTHTQNCANKRRTFLKDLLLLHALEPS